MKNIKSFKLFELKKNYSLLWDKEIFKKILNSYLIAALWTEELDNFDISDIDEDSIKNAKKDIENFLKKSIDLDIKLTPEQIGYNFWLTRNHHGVGFWNRDLGDIGNDLTKIAQEFDILYTYKDNNGKIIIE